MRRAGLVGEVQRAARAEGCTELRLRHPFGCTRFLTVGYGKVTNGHRGAAGCRTPGVQSIFRTAMISQISSSTQATPTYGL